MGGNKLQRHIQKSSSPTVATKSIILTSGINTLEEGDAAVIDVPNPFIHAVVVNEAKKMIIPICVIMVDMLVKIAP